MKNAAAAARYQANADEAIALAEKILGLLKAEQQNNTEPHWGHVGSMAAVKEHLRIDYGTATTSNEQGQYGWLDRTVKEICS